MLLGVLSTISDAAAGGVIGNLLAERRAARKILRLYGSAENAHEDSGR